MRWLKVARQMAGFRVKWITMLSCPLGLSFHKG